MIKSFLGVGIAAAAVVAMATGCSDYNVKSATDAASGAVSSVASAAQGVTQSQKSDAQPPQVQRQDPVQAPNNQAPHNQESNNQAPADRAPDSRPVSQPAPPVPPAPPASGPIGGTRSDSPTSGHGYCLDINSGGVADAFSTLSAGPAPWAPYAGTEATIGGCPSLMWMTAETSGGTASSPTQVLFFTGNGKYLGTATPKGTAWTKVVDSTDTSVSVQYKWLTGDEPNCCPQGGPLTVTYSLNGSGVSADKDLPPEVHAS